MPIHIERLPDEPIVLATMTGQVTAVEIKELFARTLELSQDIPGTIYRITDVRSADATFSDLLFILAELSSKQPFATSDPRVKGVLVGRHFASQLTSDSLKQRQYGALNLPLFDDMETALEYLHDCMAAEEQG